jgi:small subunit ribosomal protein S7
MKEGSIVPRRGNVPKREILPDPIYNSVLVTKLINTVMLDGKKGVAQKVVYDPRLTSSRPRRKRIPSKFSRQAMDNIMPSLEVKARRVGGATYQVPMEVRPERRQTLGLRWLVAYARTRSERTMKERLAGEIMDAANGTGAAVKKREDTHKDGRGQQGVRAFPLVIINS